MHPRPAVHAVLVAVTIVALLLSVVLLARSGFTALADIADPAMGNHLDLDVFRASALALWSGGDPYPADTGRAGNLNPPAWLPLLSALVPFDAIVAYRLWVLGSFAALVAAVTWTAHEVGAPGRAAAVGAVAVVVSSPALATFRQGQVYVLLGLGLVAAWVLERRGRDRSSAVVLGVLIGLKPLLLPLLLWPAARGRARDTLRLVAGTAGSVLLGLVVAGPAATAGWVRQLATVRLDGNIENTSLPSAAYRLFVPNAFSTPLATAPWVVVPVALIGVLLVAGTLWAVRDAELGLWAVVAACLLVSPLSWRGYLVLLGPAALVLLARRATRAVGALLLALASIPDTWTALWPDRGPAIAALALTLPCAVLVAHWAALFAACRDGTMRARPPRSGGTGTEPDGPPARRTSGSVEEDTP